MLKTRIEAFLRSLVWGLSWAAAVSLAVALLAVCLGLLNEAIVFAMGAVS